MEVSPDRTPIKRKKRKTRKCLDEIRKRSRYNTDANSSRKSPQVGKLCYNNVAKTDIKHYLTAGRLTLPLFTKVIRSETATRSSHLESQMGSGTYCDKNLANCRVLSTVTSNSLNLSITRSDSDFVEDSDENLLKLSKHNGISQLLFPQCSETENMSKDHNENSPASFILFSPRAAHSDVFEESLNDDSISTTHSSVISTEANGYPLYEEFMKEIPLFLSNIAPALIKEDVMKKTKSLLNNIYAEGCRRECEENILQCIKSNVLTNHRPFTMKDSIVENPMDYIRLGYTWRQSMAHKLPRGVPASSPPSPSPRSPAALPPHCPRATPEYNYYPHKLNL